MKTLYKIIRTLLLLSAFILCTNVHAQDKKEATTTTDNKDKTGVKNDDKKPDDPDDKAKKEEEEKGRKRWQTSGNYADSLHWLGTINNYPLVFKTNNTGWLRLTPAGRLGLGTNNPSASFDVIGDIRSSILGGNGNALVTSDKDGILRRFNFSSDSAHVLYGNGTWAPLPAPIDWQVSGNNMYSIPSGNVGIGVSNASERLEVAGNIKADSIILTKGLSVPPSQIINITNLTTNNFQSTNIITSRILPDTSGIISFGAHSINIGSKQDIAGNQSNRLYTTLGSGDLFIQSEQDNSQNTIINANNNGSVGIGTISPNSQYKLDVTGNVRATQYFQGNSLTPLVSSQWVTSGNNILYSKGKVSIGTTSTANSGLEVISNSPTEVSVQGTATAGGYTNAAIVLKAVNAKPSDANYRATGVFMHDDGADNEWFVGRPYAGSDRFVIQRNVTADHSTATAAMHTGNGPNDPTTTQRFFTVEKNGDIKLDKLAGKGNRPLYVDNDGYITDPDFSVSLSTTNPTSAGNDGSITAIVTSPKNSVYTYYLWSTGATDATISNLSPGSYSVTVTNTSGRSVTASAVLYKPKSGTTTTFNIDGGGELEATSINPCPGASDGAIIVKFKVPQLWEVGWICNNCSAESQAAVQKANAALQLIDAGNGYQTFQYLSFPAGNYSIRLHYYGAGNIEYDYPVEKPTSVPLSDAITIQETVTDPSPLSKDNGSVTEKITTAGSISADFTWNPSGIGTVTNTSKSSTLSDVPAGFYTCTIISDVGCKVNKNIFVGASSLSGWRKDGDAGTDPSTNFIGTTDAKGFVIKTNNATRMQITADGNVGIGKIPQYQLDVCGTIRAKEFRAKVTGCDFVFEPLYDLQPLNERKQNVLKQKHLPNILSVGKTSEIETNLGKLTQGIWQNVEEHELYLYQQQDVIERMQLQLAEQQRVIMELQKKIKRLEKR